MSAGPSRPSALKCGESPRRLWAAAVALAALVLLLLVGLLSLNIGGERELEQTGAVSPLPDGRSPARPAAQAIGLQPIKVQHAHSESGRVAAEALFFDPSPLFLPTRWNAGTGGLPEAILQEAEELFEDYAPRLRFAREGVGSVFGENAAAAALARASALVYTDESRESAALSVLGRRAVEPPRLSPRSARLEVVATASARPLIEIDLPPDASAAAPAEVLGENWQPLELAAVIDAAGLVGTVALVRSSGVETVDEFFRDYVAHTLQLGTRVGPGLYRIVAGP